MNKAQVILPPPPTLSTCSNLTSAHRNSNLRTSHHQLSAFPSNLHLFSYSHAKTLAKPRIFLPHLVASLEQVDETDIMVKPDGVQRGLVGEIISRFEKKGFKLTGLKLFQCSPSTFLTSLEYPSITSLLQSLNKNHEDQYFATLSGFSGGDSPRILDGNRPGMVGKDSGGTSARPGAAHVANRSSESSA
ncbi:hypothetical protein EV1_045734 [Malus domestica]